jgi:hypothetical protein
MSLPTLLEIQIGWPTRAPTGLTRLGVAVTLGWLLLAQGGAPRRWSEPC